MEILNKIQKELKAPKGQMNTFGNYRYRSCEDILEAVKPLLGTATLTISDEIIMLGDRFYVKATATIKDFNEKKEVEQSVSAYAREPLDKKGMDTAQITGATSSYARKYALNGLFCIDDTKDADSTNKHGKEQENEVSHPTTPTMSPQDALEAAKKKIKDAKSLEDLERVQKLIIDSKNIPDRRSNQGKEMRDELEILVQEKHTELVDNGAQPFE